MRYTWLWFMTSTYVIEISSFYPKVSSIFFQWEIAAKDAFNFGKIAENVHCLRIIIQLPGRKKNPYRFENSWITNLLDKLCFKLEIWVECKLFHCELAKKIYIIYQTVLFAKFKHSIKFHSFYRSIPCSTLYLKKLDHFNIIFKSIYSFPWSGASYQLPWPLVEFELYEIFIT